MAAKKTSKASKSARAQMQSKQKRQSKAPQLQKGASFASLESFLLHRIATASKSQKTSSHLLSELLYNITPSMRGLGYMSGFRAGLALSSNHNSSNTIAPLVAALESAGFSKILYHPGKHSVIIRASHHPDCENGTKRQMHTFEAGMIAGYLTESTHTSLRVVESRCAHGEGRVCQFIAERNANIDAINSFEGVDEMMAELSSYLQRRRVGGGISDAYFALQMLPLTKDPINAQLSKLLYVAGERVAVRTPKVTEQTALRLCSLFGLSKVKLEKGRKGISSIGATFNPTNSLSGYADLVSSFLSGMLYAKYGKVASIERKLGSDGSYTLLLSI